MIIYAVEERIDLGNNVIKIFDSYEKALEFKQLKEQEPFYSTQLERFNREFFEINEYKVE